MFPEGLSISIRRPVNQFIEVLVADYGHVFRAISDFILQLLLAIEEPLATPLAISYVCYSTTAGVADVTKSDDFPPDLREVCKNRFA